MWLVFIDPQFFKRFSYYFAIFWWNIFFITWKLIFCTPYKSVGWNLNVTFSDCPIHVTHETGYFTYVHNSSSKNTVCGLYLMAEADQKIEVVFTRFDVPCENGGLVAVSIHLQIKTSPRAYHWNCISIASTKIIDFFPSNLSFLPPKKTNIVCQSWTV